MKLATWIVKLYPRAWRERYAEEMLALLDEHQITPLTVFDLLFGVVDARLDPHYRTGRALFTFKSPQAAALGFFAAFAVCLFIAQGSMSIILQGAAVLFGIGQSTVIWSPLNHFNEAFANRFNPASVQCDAKLISQCNGVLMNANISVNAFMIYFTYGLLFFISVLVTLVWMRRIIAARRIGTALITAACFAIPVILTPPLYNSVSPFFRSSYTLVIYGGLELLMGIVFLTILKVQQAITTRRKGMLFLIILIDSLLILRGADFLLSSPLAFFWQIFPFSFTDLTSNLFPFTAVGMLLLVLPGSDFGKWIRRFTFVPVSLVTLIMMAYLSLFLIGSWSMTQQMSVWTMLGTPTYLFFAVQLPIGVVGVGLLLSALLAFAALRSLLPTLIKALVSPATRSSTESVQPSISPSSSY